MITIIGEKVHWSKSDCENCAFWELEEIVEILTKQTEKENNQYKEQEKIQQDSMTQNISMPSMPNISVPNISMPNITGFH